MKFVSKKDPIWRPFSEVVGSEALIPGSTWSVKIFQSMVEFYDIRKKSRDGFAIFINVNGPLKRFKIFQDLSRERIEISGIGDSGYLSYSLQHIAGDEGISIALLRKHSSGKLDLTMPDGRVVSICKGGKLLLAKGERIAKSEEKIHFGIFKPPNWPLVERRCLIAEFLPIWFSLGRNFPQYSKISNDGVCSYLNICREKIENRDIESIGDAFKKIFQVGFTGMFSPHLVDRKRYRYSWKDVLPMEPHDVLLGYGSRMVKSCLISSSSSGTVSILPALPIELHSGKCLNMYICDNNLKVDFEWSKKILKRVFFHAREDLTISLDLQIKINSFRIRSGNVRNGEIIRHCNKLELQKGVTYHLDRFYR